ncbi:hypothetical protein DPMN_134848 [Dreissena polymorpha]|uniref:Uncharacterized protein n=1 Tax=Dreissena polymorpha TaxID=45954 RepID=A0A9D4JC97_DREPO|nr:hypothetical protein DPMN_134848 [Dreissena polymorpha]
MLSAEMAAKRTVVADLWQRNRARFRGGGHMKIMEVSKGDGNQYAQCAGETVLGFGSTACGV